jgi:hypothetical protein
METLFKLLAEHPERFTWSDLPCCLLGVWEASRDERAEMPLPVPRGFDRERDRESA